MELNNHLYKLGVYFQCLVDAYSGKVLQIKIDAKDEVEVDEIEIKSAEEK